jgi:ParB-like chromosome segregation protein Spo0J
MRLKAMKEAGWKEAPVAIVDWDEDKQRQFIIKDNVGFGEWDWDMLANEWDAESLVDWGLDAWKDKLDYFEIEESEKNESENEPKGTDNDYSTFELVMLHENKLKLLDLLNKIKQEFLFEKQEEALMEILRIYETRN